MYQSTATTVEAASLEDYLRAIRLRKWLVLALALLGLIGALLFATSRTPTYTATSTVLLRASPYGARVADQDELPNLETEREIMLSDRTSDAVTQALGIQATGDQLRKNLDVEFRPNSTVL
ncbi:MAG: Wzz/FepE/Etk N-terminal domain-containing protein, partial [Acidimicrobiia bacterium]|nr:Wzz/FepE/Etk N-terminal domain-containing protein [Acidimicrobiia bacterium]